MINYNASRITQFRKQKPSLWRLLCAGCGIIVATLISVAAMQSYNAFLENPLVPDNYTREQMQNINANDVAYLSFYSVLPPPQKVTDRKAISVFINALRHADERPGPQVSNHVWKLEIYLKADGNKGPAQTLLYAPGNPGDCFGNEFYQALQEYHIKVYP